MDAYTFLVEKNSDPEIDNKMKTGFTNFLECLNLYLDLLPDVTSASESGGTNIYGSVTLENGAIMHATNRYYRKLWFSNVSIRMNSDEIFDYTSDQSGICYGQVCLVYLKLNNVSMITKFVVHSLYLIKVLLITKIEIEELNIPLNLALIQWYDFKTQNNPYIYGCPRLKLTEIYNFIDIEAIQDIVHIIPHFDSINKYFVNKFIF